MRFIRLFILSFFVVFNSFSQIKEPVTWNSNINKVSDENYLITIDAYIENNWRLYSQNLPKGGPEPTEFIFKEKQGYESLRSFQESKSIKKYDKLFELDLNYFEKSASFSQEIKLIDNNWIDNRTRAVTVDFGLYCSAERMFSTVQVFI